MIRLLGRVRCVHKQHVIGGIDEPECAMLNLVCRTGRQQGEVLLFLIHHAFTVHFGGTHCPDGERAFFGRVGGKVPIAASRASHSIRLEDCCDLLCVSIDFVQKIFYFLKVTMNIF